MSSAFVLIGRSRIVSLLAAFVFSQAYAADMVKMPPDDARALMQRQSRFFRGGIGARAHEPRNIVLHMYNHDGTEIHWTDTSKTVEVYFTIAGNPDASPNDCVPRGIMETELQEGGAHFTNHANISTVAGCLPNDCSVLSGTTGLLKLKPHTAYSWQARLIAVYDWEEYNGSSYRCTGEANRWPGRWEQIGAAPGYFSFFTP
ncbi:MULTISPECIES: hypothetical protein [unclassified Mesorhizobium]|uniref:hypothetical protein n=1 Tax=unclassified Mesorhizobium TaxID=325217 RepID=UPI00112E576A|nr:MULTISPECIES: hypothetical protein [unclassified Mesorhizobium]TPK52898.1 hypothetical protein FJ550_14455 [Mesorhizobium sp. B2-5-2]TPL17738.1 hypothetical protein FJ945_26065 [Mesorhizobium sp. B2-4-9]TPL21330.1 hypothetical protein FJ946_21365 [Mesorhizobium sp. B2-4-7]TPL42943.1 hypothetical protein FJ961_09705 [Mesorhizobium sp. B2-4-5]TPM76928.1 hypothetical protein FJ968_04240 [Mesorhizobium sp. B2-1-6]